MKIGRIICALALVALQACGGTANSTVPTMVPQTHAVSNDSIVAPMDAALGANYVFVTEHDPFLAGPELLGFQAPFTGLPFLTSQHPNEAGGADPGIVVNSSGDVFLGIKGGGGVNEYVPPYANPPTVLFAHHEIFAIGIDASQTLFVSLNSTRIPITHKVEVCPLPYTACTGFAVQSTTTGITVAPNGTVFVPNIDTQTGKPAVQVFENPYGAPTITIDLPSSLPTAVFTDTNSNLFVPQQINPNAGEVLEYAPPYSGPHKTTRAAAVISAMAFNKRGDMFFIDPNVGAVFVSLPPYTLFRFITQVLQPSGLALDAEGNLYVSDSKLNEILIYSAPYSGHVRQIIYRRLSEPGELVAF